MSAQLHINKPAEATEEDVDKSAVKNFQVFVSLTYKYGLSLVGLFEEEVNGKQGSLKIEIQNIVARTLTIKNKLNSLLCFVMIPFLHPSYIILLICHINLVMNLLCLTLIFTFNWDTKALASISPCPPCIYSHNCVCPIYFQHQGEKEGHFLG